MTETTNIKRLVVNIMLALAMLISMLAFTTVNAQPASAHSACTTSSHTDWHTIRFHNDTHRYDHRTLQTQHYHFWSDSYHNHYYYYFYNSTHGQSYDRVWCNN